jgi:MFS family permease
LNQQSGTSIVQRTNTIDARARESLAGARRQVAVVASLVGVMFVATTLPTPLYVIYEHTFGFSRVTLTLIYAVYVVGNLVALLLLGRTSDIIGRRKVSFAAMAVAAVSTLLFLFAPGTAWLFWARIFNGLAIGLTAGTATAWITELDPDQDRSRASFITTSSNFLGLAIGSSAAGLLAQYEPWPLQLPFVVYLVVVAVLAIQIARTRETVAARSHGLDALLQRPRLGVPAGLRTQFIAPAVTAFGAMALVGFYAALLPSILAENLGQTSHAVAGLVVGLLMLVVSITIVVTRNVTSRIAMLAGLALMLPSLALLVVAQAAGSMQILLAGTVVSGISAALGYRGSLQVVNEIAPPDCRAEIVSTYFVAAFAGNALPVIGVGIISSFASPVIASIVFAVTIAVFAIVALMIARRYIPKPTG